MENIGNWNLSTILSLPSLKVSEVIRENAGGFVEEQSEGRSVQNPLHLELHLGAWGSWLPLNLPKTITFPTASLEKYL